MNGKSPSAHTEALLEHAGWLRKLARKLVGDAQRAEDLSQETWLRALQHPPATDRPLRGWLATVMRNVLRQEVRGNERRAAREQKVAHGKDDSSTDDLGLDLLEKVAVQRELTEAVLALDEPYRTTIVLRYFESMSPKKIAAQQAVPVPTVKTRLQRGLNRLRERLDEKYGKDGRSWLMALIPLAGRPLGAGPALPWPDLSLGALAVNTKLLVAAVAVGVVGATLVVLSDGSANPSPTTAVAASPSASGVLEPRASAPGRETVVVDVPTEEKRQALEPAADPAGEVHAVPAGGLTVRGRVIDVDGRPVADAEIWGATGYRTLGSTVESSAAGGPFAVSGLDGGFVATMARPTSVEARDERYVTILGGTPVDETTGKETIVVVAPRIELAGRVVDEVGVPIAGASVEIVPPEDLRARLGTILDYSFAVPFEAESGASGAIRFPAVPAIAGGTMRVMARDYERLALPVPLQSRTDLVLTLRRPFSGRTLAGVVLTEQGFPVEGARVSMGLDTRRTAEDGSFTFELDAEESFNNALSRWIEVDASKLIAVKRGYLPGELTAPERDAEGRPVWPERVVLRLGSTPLAIAGRVVDTASVPQPGARVWIADPTFFGGLGNPSEDRFPRMTNIETELVGGDPGWTYVETDAEGRFRIEGLLDRDYVVQAMDPTTLLRLEEREVRAGREDLVLVVPEQATYAILKGRVVDGRGNPVEGLNVFPMCDAFRMRVQGQVMGTRHATVAGVDTDAEGRFELHDVPKDLVYLRLNHPDTIPLEWGRHVEGGLYELVGEGHDDLGITVARRCHFQVELSDPEEADEIAVLDAEGNELEISEFLGNGRNEGLHHDLIDGRSNPLAVADTGVTLVLFEDEREVRRVALHLDPREPTTVRP